MTARTASGTLAGWVVRARPWRHAVGRVAGGVSWANWLSSWGDMGRGHVRACQPERTPWRHVVGRMAGACTSGVLCAMVLKWLGSGEYSPNMCLTGRSVVRAIVGYGYGFHLLCRGRVGRDASGKGNIAAGIASGGWINRCSGGAPSGA